MDIVKTRTAVHDSLCEEMAIALFSVTYDELDYQDQIRVHKGATASMNSFITECVAEMARDKAAKPSIAMDAFCKGVSPGKEQA